MRTSRRRYVALLLSVAAFCLWSLEEEAELG